MPKYENSKITFKPLAEVHFSLLLQWLETPHVKAWWDQDINWTTALIREKYSSRAEGYKAKEDERGIHAYVIYIDEKAIGYIQFYNVYDFPRDNPIDGLPKSCAALDWYIGEVEYIGKGIGPKALEEFMNLHVFPQFEYVFVDAELANKRAVRAYEKAGFKEIKKVNDEVWMIKAKGYMEGK